MLWIKWNKSHSIWTSTEGSVFKIPDNIWRPTDYNIKHDFCIFLECSSISSCCLYSLAFDIVILCSKFVWWWRSDPCKVLEAYAAVCALWYPISWFLVILSMAGLYLEFYHPKESCSDLNRSCLTWSAVMVLFKAHVGLIFMCFPFWGFAITLFFFFVNSIYCMVDCQSSCVDNYKIWFFSYHLV